MNWKPAAAYVLARLRERSTWAGLLALASAVGWVIPDAAAQQIATGGVVLAGLLAAGLPDSTATKKESAP